VAQLAETERDNERLRAENARLQDALQHERIDYDGFNLEAQRANLAAWDAEWRAQWARAEIATLTATLTGLVATGDETKRAYCASLEAQETENETLRAALDEACGKMEGFAETAERGK